MSIKSQEVSYTFPDHQRVEKAEVKINPHGDNKAQKRHVTFSI